MSFVFTVSSFCTSAPEEREEKPRNRAFGYVAKSDALPRQKEKTASRRRSFEKEAFCRARPKSPRGVLAKEMIPGCERKCERRLAGGGGESRSERKPGSGDHEKGRGLAGRKQGREAIRRLTGGWRKASRCGSHARLSEISRVPSRWSNPAATLPERQPPPDMCALSGQLRCTIAPTSSMQGCPSCDKRAVG